MDNKDIEQLARDHPASEYQIRMFMIHKFGEGRRIDEAEAMLKEALADGTFNDTITKIQEEEQVHRHDRMKLALELLAEAGKRGTEAGKRLREGLLDCAETMKKAGKDLSNLSEEELKEIIKTLNTCGFVWYENGSFRCVCVLDADHDGDHSTVKE